MSNQTIGNVLALLGEGKSFGQIAEKLGLTRNQVASMIQRHRKASEPVDRLAAIEARLTALEKGAAAPKRPTARIISNKVREARAAMMRQRWADPTFRAKVTAALRQPRKRRAA